MATQFAGEDPKGTTPPTERHAAGQTQTVDSSTLTFTGGDPKGTAPSGSLITVKYRKKYMEDSLYGFDDSKDGDI